MRRLESNPRYEVVAGWGRFPKDWVVNEVAGVDTDVKGNVYVFSRGDHPVIILDQDGNVLDSWGADVFTSAHSVRVGPDGSVYYVDFGDHTVKCYTKEGIPKFTLGIKNRPSDTGAIGRDCSTVKHPAGPFNNPTDIAFGSNGDLFVSDGYGNARIHRFSKDGLLLKSFGEPGTETGQFQLPHGIYIIGDRLYVADRENSRIQIFDLEGRYISEWNDVRRPTSIYGDKRGEIFFVAELGYKKETMTQGSIDRPGINPAARLTLRFRDGDILSEMGSDNGCAPGSFFAPHMLCLDPRGDLYVGEVTFATRAPPGCHIIQKFVKK